MNNLDEKSFHQTYYEEIVKKLKEDPYASFLGIQLTELKEGYAQAELTIQDHMLNVHGTAHGAVIFALADYVFAAASNSYGKTAVGISTTTSFMNPGISGSTLKATAVEQKRNRKLAWYQIHVESNKNLLATMEGIVYRKSSLFIDAQEA